jgi:hypothetical protein
MERRQTKTYRLVDLRDGRVWDSNRAASLVDLMFIFTMWPPHAAMFKDGTRVPFRLVGELRELAARLEAWKA